MTYLWRPERSAHRKGVMADQCRACQHRIDTGERAFGKAVLDCGKNLKPPRKRICPLFKLDEDSDMMQATGSEE